MKVAVCLGTFDGVHKGHLAVLKMPKEYKKIAVTFSKPPKFFLNEATKLITNLDEKCKTLKSIGIDEVLVLQFEDVKDMQPEQFLDFIYNKYNPTLISCGFNYRYGKNGEGNTKTLESFCRRKEIIFNCINPVKSDGVIVSSSLIRQLLENGDIEKANSFLQVPFSYTSLVISGDKRGRTIGFPTANQKYPEELIKLKFGVYKTEVIFEGKKYSAVTNIGIRPTFEIDYVISETYIKNFSGDLYGKNLTVIPLKFLRGEVKFSSLEDLKKQIITDLEV